MVVFDDASMDPKVPEHNIREFELQRDIETPLALVPDAAEFDKQFLSIAPFFLPPITAVIATDEEYMQRRITGLAAFSESSSAADEAHPASVTALDLNATLLEGLKAQLQRLAPPIHDAGVDGATDGVRASTLSITSAPLYSAGDDADTTDVTVQDIFILDIGTPPIRAKQLNALYARLDLLKTKLAAAAIDVAGPTDQCRRSTVARKRLSSASMSGTPVLVLSNPCYFGKVSKLLPNGQAEVSGLDGIELQRQAPLDAIQVLTIAADLKRQHQSLSRQVDLFFPGARVLVIARRGQLAHATIRRRCPDWEYDIKLDRTSETISHVRAQQLIAIQGPPVPLPVVQRKALEIKCGSQLFRIHEFVYVLDMDNLSKIYMAGVISSINSNHTVVIDYENGDMDGSVPLHLLEKYDTRKDRGRIRPPNCGPVGYINDDVVLAMHPVTKSIAKAKITCVHASSCDICFLDGVVVLHMPRSRLNQGGLLITVTPAPVAPPTYSELFAAHQYVLVFSHRFQRYCTGQVQAVYAKSTPATYKITFDYGETIDKVPADVITHITNTSVLTPTKRITHNWNSVNGYMTEVLHPCKNNTSIHDVVCVPSILNHAKPPCFVGDLVMAQYRGTSKYFQAIVQSVGDTTASVLFASSETDDSVPHEHIFVVDPKYHRPVPFTLTSPEEEARMTVILPEAVADKDSSSATSSAGAGRRHSPSMQQIAVLPRRFSLSKILSGPMMATESSLRRRSKEKIPPKAPPPTPLLRRFFYKMQSLVTKTTSRSCAQ
ncbi:hypothetical protein ACHHYP_13335 [Achlya hypogyna]|uniref:Tudor domain-containing protein n=1 Tax=Achlya hypogyna TaxID=1202772 RepID=A0A1V9YFK4_ACHHY|nr:hypothetical protein ACHHYP_13335 [Achlya hypogyna]